jgi:hypothetical protein
MILTIIAMLMIPVGVWMVRKDKYEGIVYGIGLLSAVCGGLIAFIMAVCIICAHVGVDARIEENRIEYEALCERQEIVESEYEDVSKSDVIKDIAEWNKKVYSTKHWANNPWTNWFYSKRVADELKMIERRTNSGREN